MEEKRLGVLCPNGDREVEWNDFEFDQDVSMILESTMQGNRKRKQRYYQYGVQHWEKSGLGQRNERLEISRKIRLRISGSEHRIR